MPTLEVTVEPANGSPAVREHAGLIDGEPLSSLVAKTRDELGLDTDRPIVATGHQTLLWHPGILAKYIAVEAMVAADPALGRANLVVDQHADDFGALVVPIRRDGGSLGVATVTLTNPQTGVPMGQHPAFDPPPAPPDLQSALPSVATGLERILAAIAAHRDKPNAALQMASALDDLMAPWVRPTTRICASGLMKTSMSRALVAQMVADPVRCAAAYNAALLAVPEAGIGELVATSQRVELPLWRLGPGLRREHATAGDARSWLDDDGSTLLPRALFLTALVRLGMCDLFVHGTGGARYDRAMEHWVRGWLGLEPAPIAVVTATAVLPFEGVDDDATPDPATAQQALRRLWHDPEGDGTQPGPRKRALLEQLDAAPRRSRERRRIFDRMHETLAELRGARTAEIATANEHLETARRHAAEAPIRQRRTWAFPLYPASTIDDLAARIAAVGLGASGQAGSNAEGRGGPRSSRKS